MRAAAATPSPAQYIYRKDVNAVEDLMKHIFENSFSVVVAAFLLIRMERRMDDLIVGITRLEAAIAGIGRKEGQG